MKYEEMLDRAIESLPEDRGTSERFEMPKVQVLNQGSKTIVVNFGKIMKELHREDKHAMKYFTSQAASAANMDKVRLVLKGVFTPKELQGFLDDYVKRFVLCKECNRPDTKIKEQKGVKVLKCSACGALSAIKE